MSKNGPVGRYTKSQNGFRLSPVVGAAPTPIPPENRKPPGKAGGSRKNWRQLREVPLAVLVGGELKGSS